MTTNDTNVRKMILKSQLDKQGTAGVYIEISSYDSNLKRTFKRVVTGERVKPGNWSNNKQEVLKKDADYESKNKIINDAYILALKPVPVVKVKAVKAVKSITHYITEYAALRKANGAPYATYKEYTTLKHRITEYEKHIGKTLYFGDMTLSFSDSFNIWMNGTQNYGSGTIEKTYVLLRTFIKHYHKRQSELDIIINDIWKDDEFKHGKASKNEPHPVTASDYTKLLEGEVDNAALLRTRDRFLFQCSTGLRFGDAFTVTPGMIVDDCIKLSPSKTKHKANNVIYINLNDQSRYILRKYGNDMTKLAISNQKYNDSIQELCDTVKTEEVYTSHDARDTFITFCINAGVSIPIILSWTGQESYEVMKRYFRIDEQKKQEGMSGVSVFTKKRSNVKKAVAPKG